MAIVRVCKGFSRMRRITIWMAMIALAFSSPQLASAFQAMPPDCAAMEDITGNADVGGMGCDQSCLFVRGSCSGCPALAGTQSRIDMCALADTVGFDEEQPIQFFGIGEPPDPPPPRIFSR